MTSEASLRNKSLPDSAINSQSRNTQIILTREEMKDLIDSFTEKQMRLWMDRFDMCRDLAKYAKSENTSHRFDSSLLFSKTLVNFDKEVCVWVRHIDNVSDIKWTTEAYRINKENYSKMLNTRLKMLLDERADLVKKYADLDDWEDIMAAKLEKAQTRLDCNLEFRRGLVHTVAQEPVACTRLVRLFLSKLRQLKSEVDLVFQDFEKNRTDVNPIDSSKDITASKKLLVERTLFIQLNCDVYFILIKMLDMTHLESRLVVMNAFKVLQKAEQEFRRIRKDDIVEDKDLVGYAAEMVRESENSLKAKSWMFIQRASLGID